VDRKKATGKDAAAKQTSTGNEAGQSDDKAPKSKSGSWQRIEALRERAALKASLADVWDEDFDLDEEILAELDHTAEFFTTQEEPEEDIPDEDDDIDDYFEDEEV
jgi:hypothetical protein